MGVTQDVCLRRSLLMTILLQMTLFIWALSLMMTFYKDATTYKNGVTLMPFGWQRYAIQFELN